MATDLGTRIKRARQLLGLTQAQLGTRVGATARAVGSWERGEKVPRNLYALEGALAPHFSADGLPREPEPPADPRERELYYLLLQQIEDMTPAEALAVIGDARRRRAERRSA